MSYKIIPSNDHHINLDEFMDDIGEKIYSLIVENIAKHISIKLNVELFGFYTMQSKGLSDIKSFNTRNTTASTSTNPQTIIDEYVERIRTKMMDFLEKDSGKIIR